MVDNFDKFLIKISKMQILVCPLSDRCWNTQSPVALIDTLALDLRLSFVPSNPTKLILDAAVSNLTACVSNRKLNALLDVVDSLQLDKMAQNPSTEDAKAAVQAGSAEEKPVTLGNKMGVSARVDSVIVHVLDAVELPLVDLAVLRTAVSFCLAVENPETGATFGSTT